MGSKFALLLCLVLALALAVFPVSALPALAEDTPADAFICERGEDGGITITGLNEEYKGATELVIPAEIDEIAVTKIGGSAFEGADSLVSVTIPPCITEIGGWAFEGCTALSSVNIPDSVIAIGYWAFAGCTSLTEIRVGAANPNYASKGSVLFNKDKTELLQCPAGKQGNYAIPDGVLVIGDGAFSACARLTDVTIPDSVRTIGWGAFTNCASLVNLVIPDSVTRVGEHAFENCASLVVLTLGKGVTVLGGEKGAAFAGCPIVELYYTGTEEQWKALDKSRLGIPPDAAVHFGSKAPAPVYTATLTDMGDGTASIVAVVPAGVSAGKIVVGVSKKLSLIPDSLRSGILGAEVNENYAENGVSGACTAFERMVSVDKGAEAFKAKYRIAEGAKLGPEDFFSALWQLKSGGSVAGSGTGAQITKVFVTRRGAAPGTYTVTLTDRGDGTATISAAIPAGIRSGRLVVTPTAKLTLIPGSLRSPAPNAETDENYEQDGITGQFAAFSGKGTLPQGVVAFQADYAITGGAALGVDDIVCKLWDLADDEGVLMGDQGSGDVVRAYIPNPAAAREYSISVTGGRASKASACAGDTVTVTANASASGCKFRRWTALSGNVAFSDPTAASTSFTMPACNVRLRAEYAEDFALAENETVADYRIVRSGDGKYLYVDDGLKAGRLVHEALTSGEYALKGRSGAAVADSARLATGMTVGNEAGQSITVIVRGDVNFDSYADNIDAAAILMYDAGLTGTAKYMELSGDLTGDGEIDNLDAAMMLRYDAGLISAL